MDQQPRKGPAAMTRGQTSLDFLMTYGWAVLLVVAVVASLFVLGVFNIGSFIGPRSTGFSQLSVIAWNVNSAGDLALRLQNFAGMDINIVNIDASYGTSNYSFPITNVSIPNSKISDTFNAGTITGLAPGQYYTLPLRITYVDLNGFNYTETGTISGTVGAGAAAPSLRINSPHSDSLVTNWTVNVSFTVTGANLSQADVSIINSSGVVDSASRSSPGTYTVPLSVSSDGVYDIEAVAYYNDGSNITASATNITVDISALLGLQCGDSLDQEGRTYVLTSGVSSTSESCFNITASGVTLDCNGSAITGPGSFFTGDGVSVNGHDNVTVENCIITGFEYGIHFTGASHGAILNNTANSNNGHGIWLYSSSNSTVANNIANNNGNGGGIVLESSSNDNVVSNNTANSNYIGVYLSSSSGNTISNSTAYSDYQGIRLDSSSDNSLINNTASSNGDKGIYLESGSNNNTIANNTLNSNTGWGIYLGSSSSNTVSNNNASNSGYNGITLYYGSNYNTVSNNNASNSGYNGIALYYSSNYNNIANNAASSNSYGIYLISNSNNTVSNNTASSNSYGIRLESDSDNIITNNTATLNGYGIFLSSSSNNTVTNNAASSNSGQGIYLDSSSNNNISNNAAGSNGGHSIYLSASSNNTVTNNAASSNGYRGIYLLSSSNNTISNNTASNHSLNGIRLDSSSNNNIIANNIATSDSQAGIYLESSSGNNLYNNFLNNSQNVQVDGSPNAWNATLDCGTDNIIGGPCVGGNFWANPSGTGFSEICATNGSSNESGICTVPYGIDGSNIDELPLTMNFTPLLETCGTGSTVGMISYWKFDEGAGANISDTMEDNNGTFGSPGPTWTTGQVGSALYFSGQYIDVGDPGGSLNISGHQLTMMAWINYTGSPNDNNGWIMGKMGPSTGSYGMYVRTNEGENNLSFCLDNGTGWTGAAGDTRVTTNEWHHVAAVYDGSQVKFYLDGVVETPVGMSGDIVPKPYSLKIGWEDGWNSQHFLGSMDELAIFNGSLGASEIRRMYQLGLGGQGYCNASAPLQPPIGLSGCTNISYPGDYILSGGPYGNGYGGLYGNDCFDILADNVTLDCNGSTIIGSGSGYGIDINGVHRAAVKNCVVSGCQSGIRLDAYSGNSTVMNNTVYGNNIGIFVYYSEYNTIENNSAHDNDWGIADFVAGYNNFSDNFMYNNQYGFYSTQTSNSVIYNNFFNNSNNINADSVNYWNTTLDCGTVNLIGGSCIGGNYWATPTGSGWSENSTECGANESGLCSNNYTLDSNNIDSLPLTMLPKAAVDNYVWVANGNDNTVSQVDKLTRAAIGSPIAVGSSPQGLTVDPDYVWVANTGGSNISRINKSDVNDITTLDVGPGPFAMAVDRDSVWVFNRNDGTVSQVDKSSSSVVATLPLDHGSGAGLAVDRDYIWATSGTYIMRINKSNFNDNASISLGFGPYSLSVDHDYAWVTNNANPGTVTQIDKAAGTILSSTTLGSGSPLGIAADGQYVWTANSNGTVSKIDGTTCGGGACTVVDTITVNGYSECLALDRDYVWVANTGGSTVTLINRSSDAVITNSISVGVNPRGQSDMTGYAYDMFFH